MDFNAKGHPVIPRRIEMQLPCQLYVVEFKSECEKSFAEFRQMPNFGMPNPGKMRKERDEWGAWAKRLEDG